MEQKSLRILAVDDNAADVRLIKEFLTEGFSANFEFTVAQNLKDALGILASGSFDIILLDLKLPDGMGAENIEKIYGINRSIPIVVITGFEDEKTGIGALQKGAQDYLVKGKIQSDSLIRSIRYAFERKRVEEALRQSEEQFRKAIEEAPVPVIMHAEDGEVLQMSRAWTELTGYSKVNFRTFDEWTSNAVYGEGANAVRDYLKSLFNNSSSSSSIEFAIRTSTGEIRHWLFSASIPGKLLDGRRFVVGMALDITERKRIEEERNRAELFYHTLFTESPEGVVLVDPNNGKILEFNDKACKQLGYTAEEFKGININDFEAQENPREIEAHIRKIVKTGYDEFETLHRTKDGELRNVFVRIRKINISGKDLFLDVYQDITEHKRVEELLRDSRDELDKRVQERTAELLKAQKELSDAKRLSDIGILAATVAHELRNPLAAIRMASFNIRHKAGNPLLDKHLNNIETKISESDQIINNLLFYSRLRQPHYEKVDLSYVLDECIEAAEKHYMEMKVSVTRNYKILRNNPVETDPLQMKELFGNILNNAFDAIEGGKGRIEIGAEREGKERVKLYFYDSGVGMDEEHLKRAHEPFFTTKAKGTGLGLTVCFQIVRLHNGDLEIESKKGSGTTVSVILPVKKAIDQSSNK